jgi:hypothetical protein
MNTPRSQNDALLARCRRLLHDHQSKARAASTVLDYTLDELLQLIASSPTCHWCRLPVGFDVSLDHIEPTGRGGQHALHNLCVSCRRCQGLKGMLTGAEMGQLLQLLEGLHPVARQDLERRLTGGGRVYAKRKKPAAPRTAAERAELARAEIELLKAKLENKR